MSIQRYLVQGGDWPTIFPATLKGVDAAMTLAMGDSEDGRQVRVWGVHDTPSGHPFKDLLRVYEHGVMIFAPNRNESG